MLGMKKAIVEMTGVARKRARRFEISKSLQALVFYSTLVNHTSGFIKKN